VVDRRGIIVWRNVRPERFVGRPATRDIRRSMSQRVEGVQNSHSLEGTPTVAAFSKSPYSGWTFVVGVPRSAMRAGGDRALSVAIGGAAFLLLLGAAVGLLAARRVTRAAKTLAATAENIEKGLDPVHPPTGLLEIDAAGQALQTAVQARKFTEDRFKRIFEQTSDLVLTADLNQIITDCNESAAVAVGVSREEAIGRHIAEFISSEDYARTTGMLQQKLAAGGTTRYDVRVRNSKGEWLFWEINSGLMHGSDGRAIGLHVVGRDVTERKRAEERQQLLINELNHRVKNTLAIVQALAQQSFKGVRSPDDERASFAARLATLSAAHNLLTRQSWEAVSLKEVIETAVGAVCGEEARRHHAEGPSVTLEPQTAVSIAMAFHELCTNAIKYGALSTNAGTVVTRWEIVELDSESKLRLEWMEQGGPFVEPPARRGFGTRMIERALASDLGASVELDFRREGLVCRLVAPLPGMSA
jgi:PAS domain S-box-containing protein